MRKTKLNKLVSVLLCLSLLMSYLPISALAAAADDENARVADASTMDSWRDFFLPDVLSTENAGGVWTDKSVFTDAAAFAGTGVEMKDDDGFLVSLSTIASNMTITGMASVPSDTMLVLDVSGSMNDGNNNVAKELVEAANESIHALLTANAYNRVGVVLYSGPRYVMGDASANDAVLMLPLGRYQTAQDGQYLQYSISGHGGSDNTSEAVSLDRDVVIEGTDNRPATYRQSKYVRGSTYIQKGIILAKDQFAAADTTVTDPVYGTVTRKPIVVLMSDGAPTCISTDFTNPTDYNLGTGRETDVTAAHAFVTQLSAAYAKQQIEEKYNTNCLFYTLGLAVDGDRLATSVLDPANSSVAINTFWDQWNKAAVNQTVTVEANKAVKKIAGLRQSYVDKYFEVKSDMDLAAELKAAFAAIVGTIQLQSKYFPTLIAEDEDVSGYVSFVDKIGAYMRVTDIKGVLINNTLYSGAELARSFVAGGGGALGSFDKPTDLGNEMVWAVQARLGIEDVTIAREVIGLAYQYGQLSYTSDTDFSNYIGWYSNADNAFLGFWHEGIETMPDPNDPTLTEEQRPAFITKSYGLLGAVDEQQGVLASDMMYAVIHVRENIVTGEQSVAFAVPAALIPTITYTVTLDENRQLSDLAVTGAAHPMRLLYEVALDDDINPFTVKDIVSEDYLSEHTDENGTVHFYTNKYDLENPSSYGTVNTYSYFNPSRQNDRYYYLEDTPVYADDKGTLYKGTAQPTGDKYRGYTVYKKDGDALVTETVYRRFSDEVLAAARYNEEDNGWYIPKGSIRTNLHQYYTIYKGGVFDEALAVNMTDTLPYSELPFVETSGHKVDDTGHSFYVGAVLGNNGKMSITPKAGIKITKRLADGTTAPDTSFAFEIINNSTPDDSKTYTALLVSADGEQTETGVTFVAGKADIALAPGEAVYIGGMPVGSSFTVREKAHTAYIVQSVNGEAADSATLTVKAGTFAAADFVNADRGTGNLTVAKEIKHDLGVDFQLPDKGFDITVTLSGVGTALQTFDAKRGDEDKKITTDAAGQFTVTLKHNEQLTVFDLPEGTKAVVTEENPGKGFTAGYYDDGVSGDGVVTVPDSATATVLVVNDFTASEVEDIESSLKIGGKKHLRDENGANAAWKDSYTFTVLLQQYDPDSKKWVDVEAKELDKDNTTFAFDVSALEFTKPGVYAFQVLEVIPENADHRMPDIYYDAVWHTFSVTVSDAEMDGTLEIVHVSCDHIDPADNAEQAHDVTLADGVWTVTTDFTNVVYQTQPVPVTATIDIQKRLTNPSGSAFVNLEGYSFHLYTDSTCEKRVLAEETEGVQQITYGATDTVGEGWIDIDFNQAGEYTFYIQEVNTHIPGMTYSTAAVAVTVTVTEENGLLRADIRYGGNVEKTDEGAIVFTNQYVPRSAALKIDFVTKELDGRGLTEEDRFTFVLKDAQGTALLTGTNDKEGKVTFSDSGVLVFDRVGDYVYTIAETDGDGNGITADKTVYRIRVEVKDDGGKLSASYSVVNVAGDSVVFTNRYKAAETSYAINGNKKLNGRALLNDEFTFVMVECDANGSMLDGATRLEAKNHTTGEFRFRELTYTEAGTHHYLVYEMGNTGNDHGIKYDETKYIVTLDITDNGKGALVPAVSYKKADGAAATGILFTNTYEAKPTFAQIVGKKLLDGKALSGEDFRFTLYSADADWTEGAALETVTNGANGDFCFSEIPYEKAGMYYYLVKEVGGGETVDGVVYDGTVFRVCVNITDNLRGQLYPEMHIYDDQNLPQESIKFRNRYEIVGGDTVTLEGTKTLHGRDMVDGEFTFELYQTDETFAAFGQAEQTTTNAEGAFAFNIQYTAADAGSTFYYVVKEMHAGTTVDRVTYDPSVYNVTVTVRDDGKGGINAAAAIQKNGEDAASIDFVNTYTPRPSDISVDITAQKTVVNTGSERIGPAGFAFLLESMTTGETLSARSDAAGAAVFTLHFGEQDIGNAYTYKLTERNEQKANVQYSNAAYVITVTVSLDADNNLVAALTVNEAAVTAVVAAFENVYDYTPTPPDDPDAPDGSDDPDEPDDPDTPDEPPAPDGSDDPGEPDEPNAPNTPDGADGSNDPVGGNDPARPHSPHTGDPINLSLWFALLFVSGGVITALAVYDGTRRRVFSK